MIKFFDFTDDDNKIIRYVGDVKWMKFESYIVKNLTKVPVFEQGIYYSNYKISENSTWSVIAKRTVFYQEYRATSLWDAIRHLYRDTWIIRAIAKIKDMFTEKPNPNFFSKWH